MPLCSLFVNFGAWERSQRYLQDVMCLAGVQTWLYLPVKLRSTPDPPGMLIIAAVMSQSDGQGRTL